MSFETLDDFGSAIDSETKQQFANSGKWMNVYSIILFIALGLGTLVVVIVTLAGGGSLLEKAFNEGLRNSPVSFQDIKSIVMLGMAVALLAMAGYLFAATNLFKSAKNFSAIAMNPGKENIISGFTGFRKFWMTTGIITIVMILFGIFVAVKFMSLFIALQQH